jgi:hypothetical protein
MENDQEKMEREKKERERREAVLGAKKMLLDELDQYYTLFCTEKDGVKPRESAPAIRAEKDVIDILYQLYKDKNINPNEGLFIGEYLQKLDSEQRSEINLIAEAQKFFKDKELAKIENNLTYFFVMEFGQKNSAILPDPNNPDAIQSFLSSRPHIIENLDKSGTVSQKERDELVARALKKAHKKIDFQKNTLKNSSDDLGGLNVLNSIELRKLLVKDETIRNLLREKMGYDPLDDMPRAYAIVKEAQKAKKTSA